MRGERNEKMKERLSKRCLAAFFAVMATLVMSFATAVPAFADNMPVSGGTFSFDKYLVMEEHANVPNVTFEFSITPGSAQSGSADIMPIYAGKSGATIGSAVFTPQDHTTSGKPSDGGDTATTGFKYATKSVTVDLSKVSFDRPGIYRYTIEENPSGVDGVVNDTVSTRMLDVYVTSDESGALSVGKYALHSGNPNEKANGFTNEYKTNDLSLTKKVTGNQGDRTKGFEFTIAISNAAEGTVYNVTRSGGGDETLTVGAGGTVSASYSLQHGQTLTIQGLTAGTQYAITETDYSEDGYSTSYVIDGGNPKDAFTTGEQTMGATGHAVEFTNRRQGVIPTGVLLETAPYIGLGAAVLVGLVLLFVTRRHRESE